MSFSASKCRVDRGKSRKRKGRTRGASLGCKGSKWFCFLKKFGWGQQVSKRASGISIFRTTYHPNDLSKRHQKVGVGALTGHTKVIRLVWLGSVRVRTVKPFSVEFFICFSVCKTFIFGVTGFRTHFWWCKFAAWYLHCRKLPRPKTRPPMFRVSGPGESCFLLQLVQ